MNQSITFAHKGGYQEFFIDDGANFKATIFVNNGCFNEPYKNPRGVVGTNGSFEYKNGRIHVHVGAASAVDYSFDCDIPEKDVIKVIWNAMHEFEGERRAEFRRNAASGGRVPM